MNKNHISKENNHQNDLGHEEIKKMREKAHKYYLSLSKAQIQDLHRQIEHTNITDRESTEVTHLREYFSGKTHDFQLQIENQWLSQTEKEKTAQGAMKLIDTHLNQRLSPWLPYSGAQKQESIAILNDLKLMLEWREWRGSINYYGEPIRTFRDISSSMIAREAIQTWHYGHIKTANTARFYNAAAQQLNKQKLNIDSQWIIDFERDFPWHYSAKTVSKAHNELSRINNTKSKTVSISQNRAEQVSDKYYGKKIQNDSMRAIINFMNQREKISRTEDFVNILNSIASKTRFLRAVNRNNKWISDSERKLFDSEVRDVWIRATQNILAITEQSILNKYPNANRAKEASNISSPWEVPSLALLSALKDLFAEKLTIST